MGVTHVSTLSLPNELDERINEIIFDNVAEVPEQYTLICDIEPAPPGHDYRESEFSGLGPLQPKKRGGPIAMDAPVESSVVSREYAVFALGFLIDEETLEDDLHGKIDSCAAELGRSAAYKRETATWDLLNRGFTVHTALDGNYIFVASGRTTLKSKEAMNNRPSVDAALSQTSLAAAYQYYNLLKTSSGRPAMARLDQLIVQETNRQMAYVLLETANKPGSMDNDVNSLKAYGSPPQVIVSPHLVSETAWFTRSKGGKSLKFLWKRQISPRSGNDTLTGNIIKAVTMRFLVCVNDPKWLYGTTGA